MMKLAETEITGDNEHYEEQKKKVFSNPVIWRTLGSFLNVQDLKICRLVSQNFNENVTGDTNFKDRAVVAMPLLHFAQTNFGASGVTFRHLSINISDYEIQRSKVWWMWLVERLHLLHPFLHGIESLRLWRRTTSREDKFWSAWTPNTFCSPAFEKLFGGLKNCRKLSIHIRLFCEFPPTAFGVLEDLGEMLTELEFTCEGSKTVVGIREAFKVIANLSSKIRNLRVLTCKPFYGWPQRSWLQDLGTSINVLVDIVKRSRKTLVRLELEEPVYWQPVLWDLKKFEMAFPSLKYIKLNVDPLICDMGFILDFLRAQPVLEELDTEFLVESSPEYLRTFQENVKSLKIHRVRIKEVNIQDLY